jgi:predicted ester cyclase
MGNKDTVRRMFDEVINKGNLELVDELFDPDYSSKTPQGTFDRESFKQYILGWRTGFPDVHCEVADFVEEGDMVAWRVHATGTQTGEFLGIPATGRSIDNDSLNIGWFKDGRGYRHIMVMDTMEVMQQLGLVPEPAAAAT